MTKKVEPGESLNPLVSDEVAQRALENSNANPNIGQPLQAVNSKRIQVVVHHANQTESDKDALALINKYFVHRKGSTQINLANCIIKSNQTLENFNAFMYTNEHNIWLRPTIEEAYADGLYWQQKETSFIRIWRANGIENYVCATNFNMIGKFRRKKHSSPDLVPQEIKDEAISQLKKLLLVNG